MKQETNLKVVDFKNVEKICGAGPDEAIQNGRD